MALWTIQQVEVDPRLLKGHSDQIPLQLILKAVPPKKKKKKSVILLGLTDLVFSGTLKF